MFEIRGLDARVMLANAHVAATFDEQQSDHLAYTAMEMAYQLGVKEQDENLEVPVMFIDTPLAVEWNSGFWTIGS